MGNLGGGRSQKAKKPKSTRNTNMKENMKKSRSIWQTQDQLNNEQTDQPMKLQTTSLLKSLLTPRGEPLFYKKKWFIKDDKLLISCRLFF